MNQAELFPELVGKVYLEVLTPQEVNILHNCSDIVLAVHHPQNKYTVSLRTFEAAAAGAFQLSEYKQDIDLLFSEEELVSFQSGAELREKAEYYLPREGERRSITEGTRKVVLEKHTYKIRMAEMLDIVFPRGWK